MTLLLLGALLSWKALPPVRAQPVTFNEIYGFTSPLFHTSTRTNSDGINPGGVSLSGSTLYGTALNGGSWGYGTVFSVNTDGSGFTNLHNFTAPSPPPSSSFGGTNGDGANPNVGLVLWQNTLYGTAEYGGAGGRGTVFSVNTDGSDFSNLYSFPSVTYSSNVGSSSNFNSSGAAPFAGLVLSGGTLYGTAQDGGSFGNGTVFAINTDGSGFTNLHSFALSEASSNSDGIGPQADLIISGNTLYGTTVYGGAGKSGTVFALNTNGSDFTNLYNFTGGADGSRPYAGLILSGNTLYGTAAYGASGGDGTVFALDSDGSGFTNVYNFTGGADGSHPQAGLIISGNTLYGTAYQGGSPGGGTAFAVNTNGLNFTELHTFTAFSTSYPDSNSDGTYPSAGLIMSGNTLYGTAFTGGIRGNGAVFALILPGPALGIAPAGDQFVIVWPAWATNFVLQTAPDLTSGNWSNISSGTVTLGTNYVFTNTLTSQTAFFRLQQQ